MSTDPELWQRLAAFEFDRRDAALPFTSRLAREQGWTHAFAHRVIDEYRRFAFLAMTAGHPVTPSEAVDQVWHLHLTYTRNYWRDFCGEVLRRELHHEPTSGGADEGAKFEDWYARTLASYRCLFDRDAPSDIWPDPQQRFARAGMGRWVDRGRVWIIPRPAWFPTSRPLSR